MGLRNPHKPSQYPSIWLYILDEVRLTLTPLRPHLTISPISASLDLESILQKYIQKADMPDSYNSDISYCSRANLYS